MLTEHIKKAMKDCTDIIVVMSEKTKNSQWVPFEIGMSAQRDMPTVTFLVDNVELPEFMEYWPRLKRFSDVDKYILAKKETEKHIHLRGIYESATAISDDLLTIFARVSFDLAYVNFINSLWRFTMNTIKDNVKRLIEERGWKDFHRPRYLVDSLSVEVSELMNECLWHSPEEIDQKFLSHDEQIVKEMADIAINFYSLVLFSGINIDEAVQEKVDELLARYSILEKGEHRK